MSDLIDKIDFGFDAVKVRRTDPDTSREAWANLAGRVGTQRRAVYEDILTHGPSGYREIAERTGLRGVSVSTRLSELLARELLFDTGVRRDGQRIVRT